MGILICSLQLFKSLLKLHGKKKKWIGLLRFHLYSMSFFPFYFKTSGICTNKLLLLKSLSKFSLRCLTEVTALTDTSPCVMMIQTGSCFQRVFPGFWKWGKCPVLSGWVVWLPRIVVLVHYQTDKFKSFRFISVMYSHRVSKMSNQINCWPALSCPL